MFSHQFFETDTMLILTPVVVRGRIIFQVNDIIDTDYTGEDCKTKLQFRMLMKPIDNPHKDWDDDWTVIGRNVMFQYRQIGSCEWNDDDHLVGSFESDMETEEFGTTDDEVEAYYANPKLRMAS